MQHADNVVLFSQVIVMAARHEDLDPVKGLQLLDDEAAQKPSSARYRYSFIRESVAQY